jgi:hypothetical protein
MGRTEGNEHKETGSSEERRGGMKKKKVRTGTVNLEGGRHFQGP